MILPSRLILNDMHEYLRSTMKTGKYSNLLAIELATHYVNRTRSINEILREIDFLEGGISTTITKKPEKIYTDNIWHKHYMQASFILQNIGNYWRINDKNLNKLEKVIKKHFKNGNIISERDLWDFCYHFVVKSYENRVKKRCITGEWILFAKENSINYYLTLATHKENKKDIINRIKSCVLEFPKVEALRSPQLDRIK